MTKKEKEKEKKQPETDRQHHRSHEVREKEAREGLRADNNSGIDGRKNDE